MESTVNLYQTLGVPRDASEEQIRKVYRKLAQIYHPDTTILDKEHARQKFREITQAYEILSDSAKRAKHDLSLTQEFPLSPTAAIIVNPPKPIINIRELNFGEQFAGETVTRSFLVNNVGGPITRVIDFQRSNEIGWFTLTNINKYSTTDPCPIEVEVTVDTAQLLPNQSYRGWIEVNLDGEVDRVNVSVTVVSRANLVISTEALDFGTVQLGESRTLKFRIDNVGGQSDQIATFEPKPDTAWLQVSRINPFSPESAYPMNVEVTAQTTHLDEDTTYESSLKCILNGKTTELPVQLHVSPQAKANINVTLNWLTTLSQHTEGIWCLAFSPDSRLLASGGDDHQLLIWSREAAWQLTGPRFLGRQQRLKSTSEVWSAAFNLDGQTLAYVNREKIRLCQLQNWKGREIGLTTMHHAHSIAFSPDGRILAGDGSPSQIWLWDVATRRTVSILEGHTGEIRTLTFSPDGSILASGSEDGTIRLWLLSNGQEVACLDGHAGAVQSLAFSPDGSLLASAGSVRFINGKRVKDETVRLWDLRSHCVIATLNGHTSSVEAVAFHPSGTILASSSVDNTLCLWDVQAEQVIHRLTDHSKSVSTLAFSPDGQLLASGSWDSTIQLYEIGAIE